jgi:hypothetical protein
MPETDADLYRYFLSYSGVRLPLNLVRPLDAAELGNRNTYFRATYDPQGRLLTCEKLVYGEVELVHEYVYRDSGSLARARVTMGDETSEIECDENGAPIRP